jgi:hypothetical protein
MYKNDDLKIIEDPIKWLISHKKQFLWQKDIGLQLAINIVNDAIILSEGPVTILNKEKWWIIGSEIDWIIKESIDVDETFFFNIIPSLQDTQNSIRGEVLLTAFAEDVVTIREGVSNIIKGTLNNDIHFLLDLQKDNCWKRLVAFRLCCQKS